MKYLIITLSILLIVLQIRLWKGDGGILEANNLQNEVSRQQDLVKSLKDRNNTLEAEVQDLKNRLSALEERARTDLGMVRKGETFYYSRSDRDGKERMR